MRGKFRFFLMTLLVALLLPIIASASMGGGKMLKPGSPAPEFKFKMITGEEFEYASWTKGKPSLVVFIQTACGSCQRELQFLKDFDNVAAGLEILVIFIDVKEMDFKGYAKDNKMPFNFAWDAKYTIADAFGVSFAPASFLVDKDRNIAKVYRGWSKSGEEMMQDIKALTGK